MRRFWQLLCFATSLSTTAVDAAGLPHPLKNCGFNFELKENGWKKIQSEDPVYFSDHVIAYFTFYHIQWGLSIRSAHETTLRVKYKFSSSNSYLHEPSGLVVTWIMEQDLLVCILTSPEALTELKDGKAKEGYVEAKHGNDEFGWQEVFFDNAVLKAETGYELGHPFLAIGHEISKGND